MDEQRHHIDPSHNSYEHRDVNLRSILIFGFGLAFLVLIVYLVLAGMFGYLKRQQEASDPSASIFVKGPSLPPEPRLQVRPVHDLHQMKSDENRILSSFGWIDRKAGTIRIPIQHAMELLAQRGLPSRAPSEKRKEP
jgi:hypothetical protein